MALSIATRKIYFDIWRSSAARSQDSNVDTAITDPREKETSWLTSNEDIRVSTSNGWWKKFCNFCPFFKLTTHSDCRRNSITKITYIYNCTCVAVYQLFTKIDELSIIGKSELVKNRYHKFSYHCTDVWEFCMKVAQNQLARFFLQWSHRNGGNYSEVNFTSSRRSSWGVDKLFVVMFFCDNCIIIVYKPLLSELLRWNEWP